MLGHNILINAIFEKKNVFSESILEVKIRFVPNVY